MYFIQNIVMIYPNLLLELTWESSKVFIYKISNNWNNNNRIKN